MKYSIKYNSASKILNQVDEVIIHYTQKNAKDLIDFILNKDFKRIVIDITENEDIFYDRQEYINLKKVLINNPEKNFSIKISSNYDIEKIKILKTEGIPFFTNHLVSNWDLLNGLIELGVSDVYIVEALAFDLENVKAKTSKNNIQIRVFPNIAQSSWTEENDITKFFIRPEDVQYYEGYVDIFEFFGDKLEAELLYKIYNKDKKWFGKLNEIIDFLNSDIDSRYLIPKFGEARVKCGKMCSKNGKCKICERCYNISRTLEDNGIMIFTEVEK